MQIDCLLSPADIAAVTPERLQGSNCVVFDILRATSTIVTAMAHGTREVRPVRTIEEARSSAQQWPGSKLAGERHGDRIEGFDFGNSPLEFLEAAPDRLITTTTNGTIALRACETAETVLAGSLLNLGAVRDFLMAQKTERVLLVCAGTFATAALEDIYTAGALIAKWPEPNLTDAAQVALATFQRFGNDSVSALAHAANGRVLIGKGREAELRFCAQRDRFHFVPQLREGVLTL